MTDTPTPWILVLDSADNESLYFRGTETVSNDTSYIDSTGEKAALHLSTHLPQATNGCVLITSRDKKTALQLVGNLSNNVIKIEEMSPAESESLVRTRLSRDKCNHADTSIFIALLGGIPLALTQACAYLEANELITVSGYCQRFRESEDMGQRLLGQASHDLRRDPDLPNAVITTWQISFEYLESRNSLTTSLLSLFGVIDRQRIPRFLAYFLHKDRLEVDEALSQLIAFSLIKTEASNEYFELHELVEMVLHAWISKSGRLAYWLRYAMDILHPLFPQDLLQDMQIWALSAILLPHAQQVIKKSRKVPYFSNPGLSSTCRDVAVSLTVQYRHVEAEHLFKEAVELAIEGWGSDDWRTLTYQCNLASNLKQQSRLHEARKILQNVRQCLTHLSHHSLDLDQLRIQVSSNLAMILTSEKKPHKAEILLEEACTAAVELKGEDNTMTMGIMHNLVQVKNMCGKSLEAETIGRTMVMKQARLSGITNNLTLKSITNLSECLKSQEIFAEAQELLQIVAVAEENLVPRGHPDRLSTAQHLAVLCCLQDDYTSAEKILRQAQIDGEAYPENLVRS